MNLHEQSKYLIEEINKLKDIKVVESEPDVPFEEGDTVVFTGMLKDHVKKYGLYKAITGQGFELDKKEET